MNPILPIGMLCATLIAASCGSDNVSQTLKKMTLEEKVRTVVGTNPGGCTPPDAPPEAFRGGSRNYVSQAVPVASKVPGAAGDSYSVPRLGIRPLTYADGPSGLRIDPLRESEPGREFYCTAFPTGSLLASTWDPGLIRKVGEAIGEEVHEYGVDILLGPGLNIQRNPLCGRNFEYYSEDPLLTGRIAASFVSGVQSKGVGACPKHFAVNNQERFRNGINAVVSPRALREIYLRAFEMTVKEADPWTVMSSYNKVNGTFASENRRLLTELLRDEWGFKGFVMTDWWAMEDPVEQLRAGNDLLMPGYPEEIAEIEKAVREGRLSEEELDLNVARILRVASRAPVSKGYAFSNSPDLDAHAGLAREVAAKGLVLLENRDNTLPLDKGLRVALFGVYGYDTQPGGSGSGYVHRKHKVSIAEGLEGAGYFLDSGLSREYTEHIAKAKASMPEEYFWAIPVAPELVPSAAAFEEAAERCEVAVVTLGRMAGEGGDREYAEGDYLLTSGEKAMIHRACEAFHSRGKKVVVILNMGSSVEMDGWQKQPDALLMSWMPGQEGGFAVADILSGESCPSGKLPVSMAEHYTDLPSSRNFGISEGEINAVRYEEDLMVGYRYFTSCEATPAYAFGYGLSYTAFEYAGLKVTPSRKGGADLELTVSNTGAFPGSETVQIYVHKPEGTPERPALELCAFSRTGVMAPGESRAVRIHIPASDLAQYDPVSGGLTCLHGTYTFHAAAASDDLRLTESIEL